MCLSRDGRDDAITCIAFIGFMANFREVVHVYRMRHSAGHSVPARICRWTKRRCARLVRRQIDAGINFLVPCGTTGESPTLTRDEHLRVVEITLEEAKGKVPVLAGAGGYNTHEVIELARELERMGADGILSVTPYYNKPTQEGLYQHYKAIAAAIRLPIVVYSVQGRTGVNVEPATLARLAQIDNIVGVKEASGNIGQMAQCDPRGARRFHRALGRRRDHAAADRARRPRHHLGGVERDSRPR